jgi:hypothetical protein
MLDALSGNPGIGGALIVVLAVAAWLGRSLLVSMVRDEEPLWRAITGAGFISIAVFVGWVTLFDNWIQLVGDPYRRSVPWASARVIYNPVNPDVRLVSWILLGVTLAFGAAIFARNIGGYLLQLGLVVLTGVMWIPLFAFREQASFMISFGTEHVTASAENLIAYIGFLLLTWTMGVAIIVASWTFAMAVVAPFVTLLLDLLRIRQPRVTDEANDFFGALQERAEETDDTPVASRWRPIKRAV